MKLRSDLTINGKLHPKGSVIPWYSVYPFFLIHMLMFGLSGFFLAYGEETPDVTFLYLHGGFAILVYLVFYFAIFGADEVKWMFIDAALGLFGIYAQINLILMQFGKSADQFPWYVHLIPFLYYVLYTFLIHQAILEVSGARESDARKKVVDGFYVVGSILIYTLIYVVT